MTKVWVNEDEYPFEGEPPTPEKIGENDPGDSPQLARANHTHGLNPGPWFNIALALGWTAFGGGFTQPQYVRVGSVIILRGLAAGPAAPSVIGTLPVGFRPVVGTEIWSVVGNNAFARVDVGTNGNITLQIGAGNFVNLSGIWFVAS